MAVVAIPSWFVVIALAGTYAAGAIERHYRRQDRERRA